MTTTTIAMIQRLFVANLSVSRKQKSVLKRLKACKPCGHGQKCSVTHAERRPVDSCFQEERTRQWTSPQILPDQR